VTEELRYPIKYAILELKEQGGWLFDYSDITQGFIVSKCYVVESSIKYLSNGDSKITHKVVFPYKNISAFRLSLKRGFSYSDEETIPSYDAGRNPYPVDIVSDLFDSYEEAKELALQKNEEMEDELILRTSLSKGLNKEKYEKLKAYFLEGANVCQQFEELISVCTEHMNISGINSEINCKKMNKI